MHSKYKFFLIGLVSVMIYLPTQGNTQEKMGCADLQYKCYGIAGCEGIKDFPKAYEQCNKGSAPHTLKIKCFHACEASAKAGECDHSKPCKHL